ncbi:MAG: tetratricopeptide repeat-containing protein kinase family protein, partial [Acidobacteriota bacterium]
PLTVPGTIVGTPHYMAPEQVLEREANAASDQFSFCVALFEALFGAPAFGKGDMMQTARRALAGDIAPIPSGAGVPGRAKKALVRGLSADPCERFSSMDGLLSELGYDTAAVRRRWLVAGLAVLLVLAGVSAVVQFVVGRRNLCSGGPDRAAAVWNETRAAAVARAFDATGAPFASESAGRLSKVVDQRKARWIAAYTDVCEATRVRGEASEDLLDRQMACLDQRLLEMDRLLDLFEGADEAIVQGCIDAVQDLPGSAPCTQGAEILKLEPLPSDPETVAAIEAIRADLAEVEAFKVTGQFEEALAQVGGAAEKAEAVGYAPVVAQALQLKGHVEIEMGLGDEALASLRRSLVAAEKGGADRLGVTILNELVWVQGVMLQQFDRAELWSDLAEARLHRISDEGVVSAELLAGRAAVFEIAGRYDEGLELQKRAYGAIITATGSESLEATYAENQLANALYSVGSYTEALEHYRVAAALRERYLGPNHPHLATTLTSVGSTLSNLGRNEEALVVLARALEISEVAYGTDHANLGITLNNIAFAQEALGQLSEALETHDRALKVVRAAWGDDHPQTAYAHLNRVSIYRKLELWDRGLEEALSAERILAAAFGSDHPLYAYAANAEGVILLLMGRPRQALGPLETAVRIREGVTVDPLVLAQTRFSLAKALWAAGADRPRAGRLVEQSRAVFVAEGERAAEDLKLMEAWKLER